ncbi:hypothetical protein [Streptomyces sp. NPDC056549]|uniref:hypothetical protein n=1 Tax=Streptomyces sp. NPDC056549 TaxID=3345864 RepID=UPI0036759247
MNDTCLASASEIHAHLVDRFNRAICRPHHYGGEVALHLLTEAILVAEGRQEAYRAQQDAWIRSRTMRPKGVIEAYGELIPGGSYDVGMASVFAEFAQRCGWLTTGRLLTTSEYDALAGSARQWAATDRTWSEIVNAFGAPSITLGGEDPQDSKSLGYLSEEPRMPMVVFHLWNGSASGTNSGPPAHGQPQLLAVRFGDGPFKETFTFTPEGKLRMPGPSCACCAGSPS